MALEVVGEAIDGWAWIQRRINGAHGKHGHQLCEERGEGSGRRPRVSN